MKRMYWKRLLAAMLTSAMVFTMIPMFGTQAYADTEDQTETVKIAILSDIHYVNGDNQIWAGTTAFKNAEKAENRMMSEIDEILDQALLDAVNTHPDAMLVCGDLCSNGEKANENSLASKLIAAEQGLEGANIYVINGNHDINNSYGAQFTDSGVTSAERTQADGYNGFKNIYSELGYGAGTGTRYYYAHPGTEVKNYGGLSYATEIQPGVTLIALDTAQYSSDANAEYSNAQTTAGSVSDGLLAWASKQAADAKSKGNLVLAMCHHSIIPHQGIKNNASDMFFSEYLVPNWEHVAGTLADAGVSAIMTGHSHANDISQYTSKAGNTIYDIQTAALCAYPCAWRELNITIDKSSGEPKYSFDIDTHFINSVRGMSYEYDGKTYSGLQEYSYVKTGLPENALPNIAGFFIREQLYAVKSHKGGFNGFLQEKLEIPSGKSTGAYGTEEISKLIDTMEPVDENFSLSGSSFTLKMSLDPASTDKKKVFEISLEYMINDVDEIELEDNKYQEIEGKLDELKKGNLKDTFTVSHSESDNKWTITMKQGFPQGLKSELCVLAGIDVPEKVTEKGKLTADLSGLAAGIDAAIGKANGYIQGAEGDWDNNYKRTAIEKEASTLVSDKAKEAFTAPITAGDNETKPLFIARDALQAFARGDEDSFVEKGVYNSEYTAPELKEKRKQWNELLRSEEFENNMKQTIVDCGDELISDSSRNPKYPEINDILSTYLGPDSSTNAPIFTFTAQEGSSATTLDTLCNYLLGQIKTPKDVIMVAVSLNGLDVHPLSGVSFGELTNMFAELQASLTTDTNIKNDSEWAFHTISLDATGGSSSTSVITTVDDGKAGALPVPEKTGFVFQGWFTAADGGNVITKDTDLEDVTKLYAQWKPAPVPDDATASAGSVKASVNAGTVNAAKIRRAIKAAGGNVDTLVLGKKVKKISKGAFAGTEIKTLIVTSKKLKKRSVKGSLKRSKVKTVKVKVGKKKTNKKYVKKYKKIFTKKNAGRKVKVRI